MSVGAQVVFAYQSLLARIIRTFVLVVKRTKGKEKSLTQALKTMYVGSYHAGGLTTP